MLEKDDDFKDLPPWRPQIMLPSTRLKRAGTLLTLVHTHSHLYLLPDSREPGGESERE